MPRRRGWLVKRLLLVADVCGLALAFALAELVSVTAAAGERDHVSATTEWVAFLSSLPFWVFLAGMYGLYDRDEERTDHSTADDFLGVFHMVTIASWVFFLVAFLTGFADPDPWKILVFWFGAAVIVPLLRLAARAKARRSPTYLQNTLIVGAGEVGQTIASKILQHPEYGINIVGFVDDEPRARRDGLEHLALIGGLCDLPKLVRLLDAERVIVAFSRTPTEDIVRLLRSLRDLQVQVDIVPRLYELIGARLGLHAVEGFPLLGLPPAGLTHMSRLLKRALDLAVSTAALIVLAPLLALVSILIKLDSRGPVVFCQVRMGTRGETFRICKFRTMVADAEDKKAAVAHLNKHAQPGGDPRMFKIPDDPRVTRLGRLLRRYSLDELPQLINVVRGEMSLVGPRPLILAEDRFVESWARKRLDLKPGITGPWQVLGRSRIPFDDMLRLDYAYVTNWSLAGDLKLAARTIPVLLRSSDPY